MRNKVIDINQSEKVYKAISKALGHQRTTVTTIIHKWRKHGTVVNLPRSGQPTKGTPRAHRQLIQEVTKEAWTTSKALQASFEWFNNMKETVQKWHLWESSKAKTIADQKEHKGPSHIYYKTSWWSPRHSVDWWDKSGTFWKVRPITSGV